MKAVSEALFLKVPRSNIFALLLRVIEQETHCTKEGKVKRVRKGEREGKEEVKDETEECSKAME